MRLGQLARKLEIRPAEIVEFLSRNNITIEDGSNTRVEDEHTTLVIRHFNPALLMEPKEDLEAAVREEIVVAPIETTIIQVTRVEIAAVENRVAEPVTTVVEEPVGETIEVIKAPKTELPGLKVLGKIELPEIKKKEPPKSSDTEPGTTQSVSRPVRQERRPLRNSNKGEENWKNPIAQQREREAKAAAEKRKEQQELEKEKRMVHYLKKVKKVEQPAKSRKSDYDDSAEVSVQKVETPPKTWLGKFLKWLSTP